MTLLKRHLAPIGETEWNFIDDEARSVLQQKLNGRKVVSIDGPRGMNFAAYNTGRSLPLETKEDGVKYSLRNVLPLLEVEVPFTIRKDEIEAQLRGARDVDIDNLIKAASDLARIENKAIYNGLEEAGIEGLLDVSQFEEIDVSEETGIITPVTSALQGLKRESVEGPYNLVVGPYLYSLLHKLNEDGYPLINKVNELIQGEVIFAEELGDKGLLMAKRADDFQLIVGQDISIGFKSENEEELKFFLTESFTFKANAPEAVVVFKKP